MSVNEIQGVPTPETACDFPPKRPMTRKRYLELVQIASELCGFLDGKNIKPGEHCIVRQAAEEMLRLKKE